MGFIRDWWVLVWWGEAVEAWKGENWTGKMRSRSRGTDVIGCVGYGAVWQSRSVLVCNGMVGFCMAR